MKPSQPLRLYRHPISGHCHRVELYLSMLGLPYELRHVDLLSGAHKQPEFLSKNAFGEVPVLEDGDITLADSTAILVYLAERYDEDNRFWPRAAQARAEVQRWLSVASGALAAGPGAARLVRLLGAKLDYERAVAITGRLFGVLESELTTRDYLVGTAPSVADLALYAYVARAPEGGISLEPYPHLTAWLTRIEALPGFVPMTSTPPKAA
ncbi:MAG TPA: glutathione S-transferase [Polyangiaceae bacterium]|nr:glutathione S-transferase [Polyangiaceae bacterium]